MGGVASWSSGVVGDTGRLFSSLAPSLSEWHDAGKQGRHRRIMSCTSASCLLVRVPVFCAYGCSKTPAL